MKPKIKNILILFFLLIPLCMPFVTKGFGGFIICGDRAGTNNAEQKAAEALTTAPKIQNTADTSGTANYNNLVNNFQKNTCKLSDLFVLIATITNFLIGFAGFFAVVRITIAGFQMVGGSTTGDKASITASKEAITNALIGLVIVLIAYVVVNSIFSIFAVQIGAATKYSFPFNPLKLQ